MSALDVVVGASTLAVAAADAVRRGVESVVAPVVGPVARPVVGLRIPLLAPAYQPMTLLTGLARRGDHLRHQLRDDVARALDVLVPAAMTEILRRVDLTETVKRYVDLDGLVSDVDLDAVVDRLDLMRIVRDRVDLDALVATVDLDAVVGRLDLTRIVRDQVDLDLVVGDVDLDVAASRLDIDAVARRLDLEAVINRIDLVGLVEGVLEEIDLPELIRESTGTITSDTVREVRMQSISADEAVGRAMDRLRLRRSRRAAPTAVPPTDTQVDVVDARGDTPADTRVPVGSGTFPRQPEPGAATRPS